MRFIQYIFVFVLLLVALTFALLNANPVEISYYVGTAKLPLSLLLVITFAIGCVIGLLITVSWYWRARWDARKLAKKLALSEKELANLRSMPLKDLS
jgi:putative membrane protein